MKKILFGVLLLSLVCCWSNSQWVIEETGEIITDYADTLWTSVSDARTVTDLYNQKQEALKESLDVK